jgi:hypothetical protein
MNAAKTNKKKEGGIKKKLKSFFNLLCGNNWWFYKIPNINKQGNGFIRHYLTHIRYELENLTLTRKIPKLGFEIVLKV